MRLVATSDTHKPVDPSLIPDGDVFVHAGDLCETGYPDDFNLNLQWLAALPHKYKFFIPGNHDFHLQIYPGPALQAFRKIGFTVLGLPGNANYYTAELPNQMKIGGFPLVDGLQDRWAFGRKTYRDFGIERPYEIFSDMLKTCSIIVTHAPIFGFKDRSLRNTDKPTSVGDKMMRQCVDLSYGIKTKHFICGHIHEDKGSMNVKLTDGYEKNFSVHNVSMCDRNNEHVGRPLVLDL